MFKRPIRTRLNLIRRDIKIHQDGYTNVPNNRPRVFNSGDLVQVRCYTNKSCKWKYGVVSSRKRTLHYDVMIDGIGRTQHVDQIRHTAVQELHIPQIGIFNSDDNIVQDKEELPIDGSHNVTNGDGISNIQPVESKIQPAQPVEEPTTSRRLVSRKEVIPLRRSLRIRKPP
ncbi:hypothetical protein NQ314_019958 [Rhamnusium bicolor]|uniref:Uncharacterized protein n=1 Tax=Rhamnusium bicolor TaxID=1586634 RepID=A0AAV8WLZ8_9CUCU|nr:hypothetical protein NQ314_019958 [Rhamnusium bicolor]